MKLWNRRVKWNITKTKDIYLKKCSTQISFTYKKGKRYIYTV